MSKLPLWLGIAVDIALDGFQAHSVAADELGSLRKTLRKTLRRSFSNSPAIFCRIFYLFSIDVCILFL